jgi:hypothetical protein
MTTTYVHTQTEYEIEACKRDAAKRAQMAHTCKLTQTGNEVNPYDQQSETYSHIFDAATAMSAKIERRAALDAEIPALEAEIAAATEAKTKRSAELDAEIAALMVEIAAAKTKRNLKLAAMDAEITALEAEIAAHRK